MKISEAKANQELQGQTNMNIMLVNNHIWMSDRNLGELIVNGHSLYPNLVAESIYAALKPYKRTRSPLNKIYEKSSAWLTFRLVADI